MADSFSYDGFISYSHAADGLLAPRLQAGLQRFAKPWWKRRALRLFRDESSLSANPHLWSSITEALDQSGWFVLLLSPAAAGSEWVGQEIEYWTSHRDPSRILPVVTDGEFGWSDGYVVGDAVPAALRGVFSEEPRWLDLRWAKDEDQLDLQDPRFADAVADIGSALRGVPKDELASEEVRQHRRTVRTAWVGGVALAALAVLAGALAIQSSNNAAEAERQAEVAAANAAQADSNAAAEADARNEAEANALLAEDEAQRANANAALAASRELAASGINVLGNDPELAALLAIRAIDTAPAGADIPFEVVNALWQAGGANRLVGSLPSDIEQFVSLSGNGDLLAVSGGNRLTVRRSSTLEEIWSYTEDTVDTFTYADFSADGRLALGVIDSTAVGSGSAPDSLPNRIVILDAASGDWLYTIELPQCTRSELPRWSPDGSLLALTSGADGCLREDVRHWLELLDTSSWERHTFLPFPISENGPLPLWDDDGTLFALRPFEEGLAFDANSFDPIASFPTGGIGDVSRDGGVLALGLPVDAPIQNSYLIDRETGLVRDVLPGDTQPSVPGGIHITDDNRWVIVGADGAYTRVYSLGAGGEFHRLPTGPVESLAYDVNSERLFTTGGREGLKVWDLRASVIGVANTGDLAGFDLVSRNSFERLGDEIVFNAFDTAVSRWSMQLFDPATGGLVGDAFENVRKRAAFPDGSILVWEGESDRNVVFDPASGSRTVIRDLCDEVELHGTFWQGCAGPDDPWVYEMLVSHDGALLALGRDPGGLPTGDVIEVDPLTGQAVSRTSDTRLPFGLVTQSWAAGNVGTGMEIVARDTGEVVYSGPVSSSFELSASGKYLAFETDKTQVIVLDTRSWEEVARIERPARVRGLAFDRTEGRLAVADLNSLSIVDIGSATVAQDLGIGGVSDAYWIDDETLVVGTNDGVFGTLSISTDAFLEATRASLTRSFSTAECRVYRIDPCPSLAEMKGQ